MESPVYENHYAALTRAVEEINLLLNKLYELFARLRISCCLDDVSFVEIDW